MNYFTTLLWRAAKWARVEQTLRPPHHNLPYCRVSDTLEKRAQNHPDHQCTYWVLKLGGHRLQAPTHLAQILVLQLPAMHLEGSSLTSLIFCTKMRASPHPLTLRQ